MVEVIIINCGRKGTRVAASGEWGESKGVNVIVGMSGCRMSERQNQNAGTSERRKTQEED